MGLVSRLGSAVAKRDFIRDLNSPLLRLSRHDVFTLRDACNGVHVFGGIGSGKTSGAGKMLAGAYLRAGMGGLVTAVKPEEISLWQRYAKEHGRSNSLVLFDESQCYNFLDAELSRHRFEGIGTVVECLMAILESAKRASATVSQRGEESFWQESTRMALRYSILPLYAAKGSISVADIIRFVSTAPKNLKEPTDPEWQKRSFMYSVMDAATRHPRVPMAQDMARKCLEFWAERWPSAPEKTTGNVVMTVSAVLDRFLVGRLQRAFCTGTSIVPEMAFGGAVILLAMPILTWNQEGIIAQQILKFFFQRAVLNRNSLFEKHRERPVFIFSDEAQETVNSFDGSDFLSTCRGSKCCVTYMSQTLPNYYAKMGGDNPRDAAHALVGKFMTQIYHSNACAETNEYASRVVGKVVTRRGNYSAGTSQSLNYGMSAGNSRNQGSSGTYGHSASQGHSSLNSSSGSTTGSGNNWGSNRGRGSSETENRGFSEAMEYAIEPGNFARDFQTGGPENGNIVTGVWFQSGRKFEASGTNFLLARFRQ